MKLHIKHMVCRRCVMVARQLAENAGLSVADVQLGEVTLNASPTESQLAAFKTALATVGFELLDDQKHQLIEKIKHIVLEYVDSAEGGAMHNLSDVLTEKIPRDYAYLSHLFSEVEGTTIEKFAINQKIERAKELLIYDERSLSEIAFLLGYSSVAHLSAQFKKVTGLTPSHFKKMGDDRRKSLQLRST